MINIHLKAFAQKIVPTMLHRQGKGHDLFFVNQFRQSAWRKSLAVIGYWLEVLHQKSSKTMTRGITLDDKIFGEIGKC